MAEIVQLNRRLAAAPKRQPPAPGEAKVVLFTGVRYERRDDGSHRPDTDGPQQASTR